MSQDPPNKNLVTQEDLVRPNTFSRVLDMTNSLPTSNVRGISGTSVHRGTLKGDFEGYIPEIHHPMYYPASNQSGMEVLGNMIGQTVAEAGLGMVEGVSYLLDLENYHSAWKSNEKNFDNWLAKMMRDTRLRLREDVLPIYDTPQSEGLNPLNGRWWAKNLPGVLGSAISLMVPAAGVARLTGYAGKALNLSTKAPKALGIAAQGTTAALASRQMESLMEANQVYEEMLSQGFTPEQAGEGAARTYGDDMKLLALDIVQYSMLLGGGSKGLKKMFSRSDDYQRSIVRESVEQIVPESLEEAMQFLSAEEAQLVASGEVEPGIIFGKGFYSRLEDYVKDEEFLTSALLGAVGGLVMPATFGGINKLIDRVQGPRKQERDDTIQLLEESGQGEVAEYLKNQEFFYEALRHAAQGRMSHLEQAIQAKMEEVGGDAPELQRYQRWIDDIPKFEKIFNKIQNRPAYARQQKFEHIGDNHTALKLEQVQTEWDLLKKMEHKAALQQKYNQTFNEVAETQIDPSLRELKEIYTLKQIYQNKELLEDIIPGKGQDVQKERKNRVRDIDERYQKLLKESGLTEDNIADQVSTSEDATFIAELLALDGFNREIERLRKRLSKFGKAKGQLEILKEISSRNAETKKREEKYLAEFLGEGVIISDNEKDYDIVTKGNGFILRKSGNPDIEGGATEPISVEEFALFDRTNKISDERLIQIANKKKNKEDLTSEESQIADAKKKEINKLLSDNQIDDSGKVFTRAKLLAWMRKNKFSKKDDTAYRNKLQRQATIEDKATYSKILSEQTTILALLKEEYDVLAASLAGTEEDIKTIEDLNNLLEQIEKLTESIAETRARLSSLDKPTRLDQENFYKKANQIRANAIELYTQKIKELEEERGKIDAAVTRLSQDGETLKDILKDIKKEFRSGRVNVRQHYEDLKEVSKDLSELETELNQSKERLDQIDKDLVDYETRLEDVRGEDILNRKSEIQKVLDGTGENSGLRFLLVSALKKRDFLQKRVDDANDILLKIFDIPESRLDDETYIEGIFSEVEKWGDEEFNEFIKEVRKKPLFKEQLNNVLKDVSQLEREVKSLERELAEIKQLEVGTSKPKAPPPSKDTPDIRILTGKDEKLEEVSSAKKLASEAYNWLRGMHLLWDNKTLNPNPRERRYFKFVENTVFNNAKKPYYLKLVPVKLRGEYSDYSELLTDSEIAEIGDEKLERAIIAIVTNKDGKPIKLDKSLVETSDLTIARDEMIYTFFPDIDAEVGDRYRSSDGTDQTYVKEINAAREAFRDYWEEIMDNLQQGNEIFIHASSKSVGVLREIETLNGPDQVAKNPDIIVNKTGSVSYEGRTLSLTPGIVYVKDISNAKIFKAYPRKLTEDERATVRKLLEIAWKANSFQAKVEGTNRTVEEVLQEYIHYGPPISGATDGGYIYPIIENGEFIGEVHLEGPGNVSLEDLLNTTELLDNWLDEQYHQVRYAPLSRGKKGKYNKFLWNEVLGQWDSTEFDSYKSYLRDSDEKVLGIPAEEYSDDPDKPQHYNTNIYFDYTNIGINRLPNKKASKVTERATDPKEPTRSKTPTSKPPTSGMDEIIRSAMSMEPGKLDKKGREEFKEAQKKYLEETSKTETKEVPPVPKEVGEKLFPKYKGPIRPTKDRSAKTGPYIEENLEQVEEWLRENLPQVPLKIVDLKKKKVWGQFTKYGQILLDPYAEQGTLYHEAFHAVIGLYLSKKQQASLFKEYEKLVKEDLSKDEIEERLAEDFREYMLTGVMPEYLKGTPKSFLRQLLDNILRFLGLSRDTIEQVFTKINTGYYSKKVPDFARLREDKNRSFDTKSISFTKQAVDGVNFIFWNSRDAKSLAQDILDGELSGKDIKQLYDNVVVELKNQVTYYESALNDDLPEDMQNRMIDLIDAREFLINNFFTSKLGPSVVDLHQDYLNKLNVTLEEIDFEESDTAADPDNDWADISTQINPKRSVSNDVKLFLAMVPKRLSGVFFDEEQGKTYENPHVYNELEFEEFEDFSKMFGILSNRLSNTETLDEMVEELENLIYSLPSVVNILEYFNMKNSTGLLSGTPAQRKIRFWQAFSKFKNTYETEILRNSGQHNTQIINNRIVKKKLRNEWENNFESKITPSMLKVLQKQLPRTSDIVLEQLFAMGMVIPNYSDIIGEDVQVLHENVEYIAEDIYKEKNPFEHSDSNIKRLLDIAYKYSLDSVTNSIQSVGGKQMYDNTQYAPYSMLEVKLNKIAKQIREEGLTSEQGAQLLFSKLPYLNSLYSSDSRVLDNIKKGIEYSSSLKHAVKGDSVKGKEFSKLGWQDYFLSIFNDTIRGQYHMLRPSDNKLERVFNWGPFMSAEQVTSKNKEGISNSISVLLGYLSTELETIKDATVGDTELYLSYKHLGKNLEQDLDDQGLILDHLSNAGILTSIVASTNSLPVLAEYIFTDMDVSEAVMDPSIIDSLSSWFYDKLNGEVIPNMERAGLKGDIRKKLLFEYKDYDTPTLARLFLTNYIIGNIEQTKVLTGHPALYIHPDKPNIDTMLKRLSGMVGSKSRPNIDPEVNDAIIRITGKELLLDEVTGQPILKTVVVQDINVRSKYIESYKDALKERNNKVDKSIHSMKVNQFYGSMDEADAQGIISLDEYRTFLYRLGDWDWQKEMTYQWEKQGGWKGDRVTIPKDNIFEEIAGKRIRRGDVERNGHFLSPLKPQYFGPLANSKNFINTQYKLSLLPGLPSIAAKRNLETVLEKMDKQRIGILTFPSGNKFGTKLGSLDSKGGVDSYRQIQSIYNEEGGITENMLLTQDTFYEMWGIQVYNSPNQKFLSSSGTQKGKQILSNLINGGVPFDAKNSEGEKMSFSEWDRLDNLQKKEISPVYSNLLELRELNEARQSLGVKELEYKLGLTKVEISGEDFYKIDKSEIDTVKKYLASQFSKRDVEQNLIDSLRWIDLGIDYLVEREAVEYMLMSISKKLTTSRKQLGKNSVQTSSTFFEAKGNREYEDGEFSSNDLQFYDLQYIVDGKRISKEEWKEKGEPDYTSVHISEMEVYLPHYFKELWGRDMHVSEINSKLLGFIGFRIPTQGLNSIENIRVKGFLPQNAGDFIVVPSEIVGKSGSDFDFDKMFLHFPSYEIVNGQPKYISYSRSGTNIWKRRKYSFTMSVPRFAKQVDTIYKEFKDEMSKIVTGERTSYAQFERLVLSNLEDLGINDTSAYRALMSLKRHVKVRKALLEEGILDAEERIVYDKMATEMERLDESFESLQRKFDDIDTKVEDLEKRRDDKLEEVYEESYMEYDKLNKVEKNGFEGIDNRMLEIYKELLSHPERFGELISPISAILFKEQATRLENLRGKSKKDSVLDSLIDPIYMINKALEFLGAKQNIGRSALNATSQILFSEVNAYLNISRSQPIHLPIIRTQIGGKEVPSLGNQTNLDGYYITDLLSEMINGYVDATTDPFMFRINAGPAGINVFALLVRLGTPLNHIVSFMNQPIILEYLRDKQQFTSVYTQEVLGVDYKYEAKVRNRYKPKTKATWKGTKGLKDISKLDDIISKDYSTLTEEDRLIQISALDQFKILEDISKDLTQAILGMRFDTKGPGKNTMQMLQYLDNKDKAIESGVIGNYYKLFEKGQYLHPFYQSVKNVEKLLAPYHLHLKNKRIKSVFTSFVKSIRESFNKEEIMDAFKVDFLTYMVQTRNVLYEDNKKLMSSKSGYSVPRRVRNHKYASQYEGGPAQNDFIDALMVHLDNEHPFRKDGDAIDNLSLNGGTRLDSHTKDKLAEAWEELYNTHDILAEDIAKFIWLQSGLQKSSLNFVEVMPNERYKDLMLKTLGAVDENIENVDRFFVEFFLNNLSAPYWMTADSNRNLGNYPAYKVQGQFSINFYLKGPKEGSRHQLIAKKEIKSIRNFKEDSTRKAYPGESFSHYVYKRNTGDEAIVTKERPSRGRGMINVYWGLPESKVNTRILSNLERRKFKYKGKEYGSVEHAYQTLKSGSFDADTYQKYQAIGGYGKKIRGRGVNINVKGLTERMTKKLPEIINPTAKKHVPKELVKTRIATQYIGDGSLGSSTDRYRKMYQEEGVANTGKYTSSDVVYISSNGKRSGRVNPVQNGVLQGAYKNVQKAMNAGATIVMDTKQHLERTKYYNIGELALAEYLKNNGYQRQGSSGIWKPLVPVSSTKQTNNLLLMEELVVESFRQNKNSEAAKKLLQYSNFTHNSGRPSQTTVIDQAFLRGLQLARKELLEEKGKAPIDKLSTEDC